MRFTGCLFFASCSSERFFMERLHKPEASNDCQRTAFPA